MKPFISAALLYLLAWIRIADSACTIDNIPTLSNAKHFVFDENALIAFYCDIPLTLSSGEAIHLVSCILDEWDAITDVTCVTAETVVACPANPYTILDHAEPVELANTINANFAAFRCSSDYVWFSGQNTVITQCISGEWTTIKDICHEECCFPKHCGDIFDLGIIESGLYEISPTGSATDVHITVMCDLDETPENLGGSWTRILEHCDGSSDTEVSEQSYIDGFGDESLLQSNFIGLKALSELSTSLSEQKMILAIEFIKDNSEIVYYATYSDFSVGEGATYTLNSIGEYHGNAGDGLCHHVNTPFNFGDGTPSVRWWGFDDPSQALDETKGSFLTKMIWGPLASVADPFTCVRMRIRPATFETDKLCPPIIGSEPSWTATTVTVPRSRYPDDIITYTCNDEFMKAVAADGSEYSTGIITCSQSYQWIPDIKLPCRLPCPDGYSLSADYASCYKFSDQTASRVGAIYRCMEEEASLADLTINSHILKDKDTEYRWIAETSREFQFLSTILRPANLPEAYGFTCDVDNNCEAAAPHQCTSITSESKYGHFDCNQDMKYICQIPGTCPTNFRLISGGCYKELAGPFTYEQGLKKCNMLGSALAWFITEDEVEKIAAFFGNKHADIIDENNSIKYLIGNNQADGTWTYSDVYPEMTDGLKQRINNGDSTLYRSLIVTSDEGLFEFSLENDPLVEHKVLCQYHGPIGCKTGAPIVTGGNMNLVVHNGVNDISSTATYRCDSEYFINGDTALEEITRTCMGQVGEWGGELTETCQKVPVCDESTVTVPAGMTVMTDDNSLFLDGTITYSCPVNMERSTGEADVTITCTKEPPSTYQFDLLVIPACDICKEVTTWEKMDVPYGSYDLDKSEITATCILDHEFALNENIQQIKCLSTGWDLTNVSPCYPVCSGPPPVLDDDSKMTADPLTTNVISTTLNYVCDANTFIALAAAGERINSVPITCADDQSWNIPIDEDLKCFEICTEPPPEHPEHGNRAWNTFSYESGTKITYTCDDTYTFSDGLASKELICAGVESLEWTNYIQSEFTCKQYCTDPPPTPESDSHITAEVPDPNPAEVLTVLDYICEGDLRIAPTQIGEEITNHVLITCNSNRLWITPIEMANLKCEQLCTEPPEHPEHGSREWNTFSYESGTRITYTCDDTYTFPDGLTSKELICSGVESLEWTNYIQAEFTCKQHCTDPPPTPEVDSHITAEVPDPNPAEVLTVLDYICEGDLRIAPTQIGEEITNHVLITCNSNGLWITPIEMANLKCEQLCPEPPALENPGRDWDQISYQSGTSITYTCDDTYTFPDGLSSKEVKCSGIESLEWTNYIQAEFTCKQYCTDPHPIPEAGSHIIAEDPTTTEVTTVLKYVCEDGFNIVPTQLSQGITNYIEITCNRDMEWDIPILMSDLRCAKFCPSPPTKPEHGDIEWNEQLFDGQEAYYKCDDGYAFGNLASTWNVTCSDTSWLPYDEELFLCSKVCSEPPPSLIGNATHNFTSLLGMLNQEITYTCPAGYANYTGIDNITIKCLEDGWSEVVNFLCEKVCPGNPPEPQTNANYTFLGDIREGVEVSYFCEGGFSDMGTWLTNVCANGTWTISDLPICLNLTIEVPDLYSGGEFYNDTAFYYESEIYNFKTLNNEPLEKIKSVIPLEDGAVFHNNKSECAYLEDFFPNNEVCANNPSTCQDGFSFSIWANINVEPENTEKRYLVSTGGDIDGSPGISMYQEGAWLRVVVSTGVKYWVASSFHHTPSGKWTVISSRWREDLGLDMFMMNRENGTMERLAKTHDPMESEAKSGLDPPQLLFGCHATGTDLNHRGFLSGALDAFVVWREVIDDMKWFPGGYRVDTRTFEEIIKLLPKIPKTADNVNAVFSEVIFNQEHAVGEDEIDTTSTQEIISNSTGIEVPTYVSTEGHNAVLTILSEIIQLKNCPKNMLSKSDIAGYHKALKLFSNLLTNSEENRMKWHQLYKEDIKSEVMNLVTSTVNFLECVLQMVQVNDEGPLEQILITENVFVISTKDKLSNLQRKGKLLVPSKKIKMDVTWTNAVKIAVWPNMFHDYRCDNRSLSITLEEFSSVPYLHKLKVNEVDLNPNNRLEIDSVITALRIKVDPGTFEDGNIDTSQPGCGFGKQNDYPIDIIIPHISKTPAVKTGRRKLFFFEDDIHTETVNRYCAWLDTSFGINGVWDISNCKIIETKAEMTRCICKTDGIFAIISHKKDIIQIKDDPEWLLKSKYILYGISMIAMFLYIIVVAISGDLKDQFHIMASNLSLALLCGSIAMVAADFDIIKTDQEICGACSSLIFYFYLSVGTWIIALGHGCFRAITAGIINGKLQSYIFMAWGFSLAGLGLIYMFFLHDIGTDPRCFVAWENDVKVTLLGPQIIFAIIAIFFALVVLCNLSTPALRKDNLIDDYGTFCRGAAFVMFYFGLTWIFGFFAFMRIGIEKPDFYPIFTILNSSMGIFIFLFIGLGSSRFRTVITGQAKHRRAMLKNYAFGLPGMKRREELVGTNHSINKKLIK